MIVPVYASLALLQSGGVQQMLFMYAAIFAIFYFVFLRPQQKQKKLHAEMVNSLKKGDEVVTTGGVVGEVLHIAPLQKDGVAVSGPEDRITIKSGEARLVIERGRITRVASRSGAVSAS